MAFLRTLFWIVLTVIVVVFSVRNWSAVTINLFGDLQADVKLPVLLLIVFLIGFLPPYIWHHAFRWQYARKRTASERAGIAMAVPAPQPGGEPAPPTAAPIPDPRQGA